MLAWCQKVDTVLELCQKVDTRTKNIIILLRNVKLTYWLWSYEETSLSLVFVLPVTTNRTNSHVIFIEKLELQWNNFTRGQ